MAYNLPKAKKWNPTSYHQHDKTVKAYMRQPPRLCRPTEDERRVAEVALKSWYHKPNY